MDEVAKTQIKDETLKICTRYMEESDLDDEEITCSKDLLAQTRERGAVGRF